MVTGTPARYLAGFGLVLAAYFAMGRLGLSLDAVNGVAAAVWAPSGIALAALLVGGLALWPAIALGAFAVNVSTDVPLLAALGIAFGNTLEAVAGALLVRRFGRSPGRLDTIHDALVLIALAGFASTTLSATIGATSAWLGGTVAAPDYARVWWSWWVGDVLGVLLVTPLVLGVRGFLQQPWPLWRRIEAGAALALLCAVAALLFGVDPESRIVLHAYFVFPPLLWAALRFGQPGASAATFALAGFAILGTAAGLGPFAESTRAENLLALQTFMGSVALTVLLLGVRSTERAGEIAERQELEGKLVVADRLAAVGTLAAGIGHEINNPLAYVILNLDAAQELAARGPERNAGEAGVELRELLGTAREGADRIRRIVADLKALARDEGSARGPTDVHKALDSCLQIAGHQLRHRARLVKTYGRLPSADANEGRLAQVFLNLLINAVQALPEGHADENEIRIVTGTDEAGRIVVEIGDTGPGIEASVRGRVFEPFFTTKPVGEGVGLGLSVCHAIVSSWGGSIQVESEPGAGTTFRVVLPPRQGAPPAAAPEPARERAPAPGPLRVLIVEDEELVARSMARALKEHAVTVAADGRTALQLCKDHDYDVILCDLLMPELAGMDVYDELCRLRPGYEDRMVFITGGAFTLRAQSFLAGMTNRTLHKPFAPSELRNLVADHAARLKLG